MRLLPDNKDIGWTPYLWLVYLSSLPISLVLMKAGPLRWTLTIAGMLAFLVLYFWGWWISGRRLLWVIAGITLLAVLFAPLNPGAISYFIYAGSFAGRAGEPKIGARILLGILLVIAVVTFIFRLEFFFWFISGLFTLIIGAGNIHFAQRHRDNKKLLHAQEEVEHMAKIAERERIARDLHDVLGHTLSLIVLKSQLASRLSEKDPQRAAREIQDVERISRDALAQVRSTIRGYHARSLTSEIEQARATLESVGVKLESALDAPDLPPAQESVLALALREAVTNVIRHSGATTCRLNLRQTGGECRLEIQDDGRGTAAPEGMGLSGMRQRVEALGGTLQRDLSGGTTLTITLPGAAQ
jgi:two-component system, NarL family, sensor histidine kinase DesK